MKVLRVDAFIFNNEMCIKSVSWRLTLKRSLSLIGSVEALQKFDGRLTNLNIFLISNIFWEYLYAAWEKEETVPCELSIFVGPL